MTEARTVDRSQNDRSKELEAERAAFQFLPASGCLLTLMPDGREFQDSLVETPFKCYTKRLFRAPQVWVCLLMRSK